MNPDLYLQQAGLIHLGFDPGPLNGLPGPKTRAAREQWERARMPSAPSRFPETVRGRTPNRNTGTNECKGIVFHHAAGWFEGTISWCLKPGTHAGYHCLVAPHGDRAILAHDTDRAHHAGKSNWNGRSGCNAFLLGIAFTGNTNTGEMRPGKDLTAEELASALEWVRAKVALHGIRKDDITHHRVISPGRKDDLSPAAWRQIQDHILAHL